MSEVKKCPKCGGEMKKGYVSAQCLVYFIDKHARLRIGGYENTCAIAHNKCGYVELCVERKK